MASNLACLGLEVLDHPALEQLILRMNQSAEPVGRQGNVSVVRWQDPSGARCTITIEDGQIRGFLPGFAGTAGARLRGLRAINDEVVGAEVLDRDGELTTKLALELEEQRWLRDDFDGPASVVGLGIDVAVFADEAAFGASPRSLLEPDAEPSEPPAEYLENGWSWPPRLAPESFISYGLFGEASDSSAHALLNGVVRSAERRTTSLTGQAFILARVSTAGFEADLCLPDQAEVPQSGAIIAGTVFLVGSIPELVPDLPKKRRWPWQRG